MLLYYICCCILLLPIILCDNSTINKMATSSGLIETSKEKLHALPTTKVVLSDGGPILPDDLGLKLLQIDHKKPVEATDLGKNKVKARKGVIYSENATQSQEKSSLSSESTTNKINTTREQLNSSNEDPIETKNKISEAKENSILLKKITSYGSTSGNNTATPKKPLTLVAKELENMTVRTQGTSIDNNYGIQSPKKTYITSSSGPGMVMPIVITILIVPMFAVLGLMALRRGQEAWKNRHYKRMDFLLDGMYND